MKINGIRYSGLTTNQEVACSNHAGCTNLFNNLQTLSKASFFVGAHLSRIGGEKVGFSALKRSPKVRFSTYKLCSSLSVDRIAPLSPLWISPLHLWHRCLREPLECIRYVWPHRGRRSSIQDASLTLSLLLPLSCLHIP